MNRTLQILTIISMIYCCLLACSKKQAAEPQPAVPEPPGTVQVTYNNYVAALFQRSCSSCHASGGSGAALFNFNGYASVVANAARIKQAVLVNKTMPQGSSLSQAELQSLQTWFDLGMPQQ